MRAYKELPPGFGETERINLQKDKKAAIVINIAAAAVMLLVLFLGYRLAPQESFTLQPGHVIPSQGAIAIAGLFIYMLLHELTHAAAMKAVGGGKVRFGFTGLYAYAGSREDYFDKAAYTFTALAPLALWGVVLGLLAFTVPGDWFWVVWLIQAANIAGSAGDIYVTAVMRRKPPSVLIKDTGVEMTVYDKAAAEQGQTEGQISRTGPFAKSPDPVWEDRIPPPKTTVERMEET